MADDTRERYINPYTDFGSKKVFWDNYSVMKTARDKGVREGLAKGRAEGVLKEKTETVRRLQAMGLTIEQIAQGVGISIDEVKKLLAK